MSDCVWKHVSAKYWYVMMIDYEESLYIDMVHFLDRISFSYFIHEWNSRVCLEPVDLWNGALPEKFRTLSECTNLEY